MTARALQRTGGEQSRDAQPLAGARILVIMPSIPVQGMERANLQIMKMMRQRGADVLFVTEKNYGERVRTEVGHVGCRWVDASCITSTAERPRLPKGPREFFTILRALLRAARQINAIAAQYRPTHIHVTNLAFFLYALPAIWLSKRPVVFRLPNPPDTNMRGWKRLISDRIWRYAVAPQCDLFVCNSKYTLSQLREAGVRSGNVRIIYNCVPERVQPPLTDAPKVDASRFNVVYTGRIRPEKGVRELYDAACQILGERQDVDFYFVGENRWMNEFAESLERDVKARSLETRIRFTGEIQDIPGLLEQCDLHVCPSVSEEPFGIVVLEAKSAGLPSVVFPSGGLKETVTHLVDGYVCQEKSARALYEGIRYFLDHPEALSAAGGAARHSLHRFSGEKIGDQWCSVFLGL